MSKCRCSNCEFEGNAIYRSVCEYCIDSLKSYQKLKDDRRFEAAKTAMGALMKIQSNNIHFEAEVIAETAIVFADALLKGLEK